MDKNKKQQNEKQKQELAKLKQKYFDFYDDIKNHTNGYEDW